ncbi:MAG: hypothetical protein DRP41_01360 [Thermodesulfobacteriota bacterium]|nr:MAG: hypothetical protein DRP41_01360 [Thermodesulfobacteriota bacterium]
MLSSISERLLPIFFSKLVAGIIISGCLICAGCGVAVRTADKGIVALKNSRLFHQGRHGELTEQEKRWAKIAWRYFENNYQPKTGLVNSVDNYPSCSMWDIADYLAALIATHQLGLIKRCEFDKRLSKLLSFLNTMDLFWGKLPNILYNTQTGAMVNYQNQPEEIGWSAVDIGRLLIWLKIAKAQYPVFAEYIDKTILRWNFCDILDEEGTLYGAIKVNGKLVLFQEGRLGYEEYAAKGFQAWGFNTKKASKIEPYETVKIYGIKIPYDARDPRETKVLTPVLSLPFILDGLEFNWDKVKDVHSLDSVHTDSAMAHIAENIYKVQALRYKKEKILTARTDHMIKSPPFFVYDSIFASGYPWNTISDKNTYIPKATLIATKAAFGMWALWNTDYTDILIRAVQCLYNPERGWYEGRQETTGDYEKVITANSNAIILEVLLYKKQGKLYNPKTTQTYYDLILQDPFKGTGKCLPKPE